VYSDALYLMKRLRKAMAFFEALKTEHAYISESRADTAHRA